MNPQLEDKSIDEKEYSLVEFYYILKKHLKIISLSVLSVTFFTIYYTLIQKPIYRSTGTIMVSDDKQSMSMLDIGMSKNRNFLENEIKILGSRSTSERVVEKLLDSDYKNHLHLFGTKEYSPVYYRKYLTLGLLDRFQDTNEIQSASASNSFIRRCTSKLRKSISISNQRNTDVLEISVTSIDPNESALLVNTLIDVYRKRDLDWATGEMTHLKSFLDEQIKIKEIEISQIEDTLKAYQEKNNIFSLDDKSSITLDNLRSIEAEHNKTLAAISIAENQKEYYNNQLTNDEKKLDSLLTNTINEKLRSLKLQKTELEKKLISLYIQNDEEHSTVKDIKNKIEKVDNTIKKETIRLLSDANRYSSSDPILYRQSLIDSLIVIKSNQSGLKSKSVEYKKMIDKYNQELSSLPEVLLEFTRLERDRSIKSETYSFMMKKMEDARIREASKIGKVRVIDKAVKNPKPIKPKKFNNVILGLLLGLMIGVGSAMAIEYFDNTIKSIEQIERRGLNILALIPEIQTHFSKRRSKKYVKSNGDVKKMQRRLIIQEDPKSPISEAYRGLRTSLMYSNKENSGGNIILVSSSGPGEGKTTTIANLAITYANLGKKTLLIDSDLRKPVVHKVFNIPKEPGLTSYLSGSENDINKLICKTEIENFDVIPSGVIPPNPSELLNSKEMSSFVNQVKEKYDMILFDSPPLIAVTDAYVLLNYTDQFVLVVRAGITEKGGLKKVLSDFNLTNNTIDGVVMNAVNEEHSYGSGYYYNYYQYYYGEKNQ